ncbi:hypothetical protein C0584_04465 [Candidatus Parcubacteria bacterium]|nr:MAG: hypothetical protein C0584_04465 [Candidatus Parcubacteria bacterium]
MMNLIKNIRKKVNGIIRSFTITGVLLIFLGILILKNDYIFTVLVALFMFIVAYTFLSGAYKLWSMKKDFDKYLNK